MASIRVSRLVMVSINCAVISAAQGQIAQPVLDVTSELALRVVKGPGYFPGRAAIINAVGELEAAIGNPLDCVRVDGSAGPCGGDVSSPLPGGRFDVTKGGPTTLRVGSDCTPNTPCKVRFGNVVYSVLAEATLTILGGSGLAYIYISPSGTLMVGHSLSVLCSSGCVTEAGVQSFPAGSIPLFNWSATNGVWDPVGVDQRAFLSATNIVAGIGLTTAEVSGRTIIDLNTSVTGQRVSVPATSTAACSQGFWAADASFFYMCVAQNTWRRAPLSSF
jgi:hypothetical protein